MDLDINPEPLSQIILLAHEYDEGLPQNEEDGEEPASVDDVDEEFAEEHANDPAYQNLKSALDSLRRDELTAVVALVWIGRGTYDKEELEDALEEAGDLDPERMADYLIGTPLLGEYLEEGMDRLGIELAEL